jgi:hypothetical protein
MTGIARPTPTMPVVERIRAFFPKVMREKPMSSDP